LDRYSKITLNLLFYQIPVKNSSDVVKN
jgi:hypothetical protein